jgi:hypothetical protein
VRHPCFRPLTELVKVTALNVSKQWLITAMVGRCSGAASSLCGVVAQLRAPWWPQQTTNVFELLGAPGARQPTLPTQLLVTANTALPGIPYLLPDVGIMPLTFVGRCVASATASTTTPLLLLQWRRLRSR